LEYKDRLLLATILLFIGVMVLMDLYSRDSRSYTIFRHTVLLAFFGVIVVLYLL
jgi:ABC-type Fe3+-siderophore transport system permease subunit